jgi:hypothetical protein
MALVFLPENPFYEKPPGIHIKEQKTKKILRKYLKQHPFCFAVYKDGILVAQSHLISNLGDSKQIYVKVL